MMKENLGMVTEEWIQKMKVFNTGRHFTVEEISFLEASNYSAKELDSYMKDRNILPMERILMRDHLGIQCIKPIVDMEIKYQVVSENLIHQYLQQGQLM